MEQIEVKCVKKHKLFRKYCSIASCNASSQLLSYHRFPKNPEMRKKWLISLKIDTEVKQFAFVCCKHFKKSDFIPSAAISRRKLKKNAIPNYYEAEAKSTEVTCTTNSNVVRESLPESFPKEKPRDTIEDTIQGKCDNLQIVLEKINYSRKLEATNQISSQGDTILPAPKSSQQDIFDIQSNSDHEVNCISCTDYTNILCEKNSLILEKEHKDTIIKKLEKENLILNIKLNSFNSQHISHSMFALDDKSIKYYTGFINYSAFTSVFEFILPSGNTKDIISNINGKVSQVCKLNAKDQFFLFLLKLRRGFDYEHIAYLFSISESTACRIFQSWLYMSYFRLGSLNIWPHRNVLLAHAPKLFKEKYPQVIASIDCTELYIETPSSLHRQSQCFSNYKSNTTLKGLIAIEPRGGIIFVSELYTGSISDVKIITDSGFVKIVKNKLIAGEICAGDIILADKRFNVGELLEPVKLNLPSFKSAVKPFTDTEIYESRKIASARVHVERVIRQIKTFKILKNIKISQCGNINQIWTVCALLCNFMYPVVTDNKEK